MENILVTGGAGYIGTHLCVALIESGLNPIIYDNLINSQKTSVDYIEKSSGFQPFFIKGDLRETDKLKEILTDQKIDAVIHLAGLKSVSESFEKPLKYHESNVLGSQSLLKAMQLSNTRKLVFSSSATVYGNPRYLPIDELHSTEAISPYGSTKIQIENMLRNVTLSNKGWQIVCLRYFNPIGAHPDGYLGDNPKGIPNNLLPYITQVADGKFPFLKLFGANYKTRDGSAVRDYIHVLDLVEAHIKAIRYLRSWTGIDFINLGTGSGVSVLELIAAFEKVTGKRIPYEISDPRNGDVAACYAKVDKAKRKLDWQTSRTIDDMCASAWKFQKNIKSP